MYKFIKVTNTHTESELFGKKTLRAVRFKQHFGEIIRTNKSNRIYYDRTAQRC